MDRPRATVREIDGKLVLDDPDAAEVISKANCRQTLELNAERVEHFKSRVEQLGKMPKDVVIVLVNVDDPHGAYLAEALMPGINWQPYRDRGEVPFARGLAMREGVQSFLETIDEEAAKKLSAMEELAVVVVDHYVAEVFSTAS